MAGRILAAIALAVLGLLIFVLAFIRSDKGGRDLCALAQATLKDVAHERVVIGRCSVDPINTRVVINEVEIGPPDRLLFGADRLALKVDNRGFLQGKLLVQSVELDRPRVRTDLSQPSKEAKPARRRPPGAACLPDVSRLGVGLIQVTNGSFHALLPEERGLALEGVNVSIRGGAGEKLQITLDATRTVLADADGSTSATRTAVQGTFDFGNGTAQVDEIEVRSTVGTLKAHGALTNICSFEGSANAQLAVDFGRLHEHLLRKIPNLDGTAAIEAGVKFHGEKFEARLKADVKDADAFEFSPGDFSITARATPEQLVVENVRIPLEGGSIIAKGALDLAPPFRLDAHANMSGFVLGEVLERVGVTGLPVQIAGSGDAHLAGPLVGPEGMALRGNVDLRLDELGVYDRSWRHRKKPGAVRYVGVGKGTLKSDLFLTSRELRLQHTQLTTKQTDLTLAGIVAFDPQRGLSLSFDAPRVSLGELGPFARTSVLGQGWMRGTISGPYLGLNIEGETHVHGLNVIGYELGDVAGDVRIDLEEGSLTVSHMEATKGESTYSGGARLSFKHGVTMDARVSLDAARATDLLSIAEPNFPSLKPLADNVEAFLTGDVEMSGPVAKPTISTQLRLAAGRAYGQRFESGLVRATMEEAAELKITSLKLRHGFGEIAGTGSLRFVDKHYELNLRSQKLQTSDIDALAAALPQLTGGVSFSLTGEGTLDNPQAFARVTLREWRLGEQPLATTRLMVTLNNKLLTADGEVVSTWPVGMKPPPHAPSEDFALPPRSMRHTLHATMQLHDDLPFELLATLDIPDASVLTKPGSLQGLKAAFSGRLHATGMAARPLLSTEAQLDLMRLSMQQGHTHLENSEPVHAVFKNGVLAFDAFPLRGTAFDLDASGTWTLVDSLGRFDINGPKNFGVQGHLNLAILRDLVPDLEEAKGELGVNFELSNGNGKDLVANVTGSADLKDVRLRLRNFPMDLTDGNGGFTCNFPIVQRNGAFGMPEGHITVDNITARLNGGDMSLSGDVKLDDKTLRSTNLVMQLDDVPFTIQGIPITIAGTPTFTRKRATEQDEPNTKNDEYVNILGGDVKLVRLHYEQDLELERALVNAVDFSRRPPAPKVFEKAGEFLKLDMGLTFGDVRVSNNLLKAKFDGDLRVTGTNRRPGLIGTVSFSEGKATVRSVEYSVSSGVVNFIDSSGIRPTFDVRADAHISHSQTEYTVHVTATGTPQQPKLLLTSEPALSDADILTLITIGVINSDLEHTASTGASLGGVLVDAAYNASGLSQQMKNLLPQNEILKDAQFHVSSDFNEQTGNIEPVAQFETKVVKDTLKLRGQTSLLGARGRKAQVEVKLKSSLDAQGQWDGDKPGAPSYGDFGADLRLHWEQQ